MACRPLTNSGNTHGKCFLLAAIIPGNAWETFVTHHTQSNTWRSIPGQLGCECESSTIANAMVADWRTVTGILDGRVSFHGSFLELEAQQADTLFANTDGQATPGNWDVSVGLRRRSWLWTLQDIQGACDLCWVYPRSLQPAETKNNYCHTGR